MLLSQAIQDLQNLTKSKVTYEQVGYTLGVSAQAISNRIQRNSELKEFEWEKLKDIFLKGVKVTVTEVPTEQKDFIEVDYYPEVFGSCGTGTFVPAEYKEKLSVSRKLFTSYSPVKHYSVINAFGDSMTPYIHDKDKLIVEHYNNGEQIKDDRVYVFRFKDKIFCKRLVDNITHVVVKSDNPMYEPIKINYTEDFQIIGRIIGMIRNME